MLFTLTAPPSNGLEQRSQRQLQRLCRTEETLRDTFGRIQPGHDYPYVSGADWSTHDLIAYLLEQTGPAELTAATWSVGEHVAHRLITLMEAGQLSAVHMLVDWRVQVRTPSFLPVARHRLSKVSVTSCHAKVFTLLNDDWGVAVVGSANFTNNPRIEAGHLTTSRETAEFHRRWILAEIDHAAPFGEDMRRRGKKDGRR